MPKITLLFFIFNWIFQGYLFAFQEPQAEVSWSWSAGQFVINLVAIIAGGVALWKYITHARSTLKKIEDALPTLFDIAKEFNPNAKDGDSLRHTIDTITAALVTLQAQCELLLETAPSPIFVMDKKGSCTFVNSSWQTVTGLTFEDAIENGWTTAIHDSDRASVFREWRESLSDDRPFFTEFRFVNEIARKIHYVRARATAITDKKRSKELIAYIGQLRVLKTEDF